MTRLNATSLQEINALADNLLAAAATIDGVKSRKTCDTAEPAQPEIGIRYGKNPDGSVYAYVPDPKATQQFADHILCAHAVWSRILALR